MLVGKILLVCKDEYDPPGIGTIAPLFSAYAQNATKNFVKQIGSTLENKGLINAQANVFMPNKALKVRIENYRDKVPVRRHNNHWIDGRKQIAVFHPTTNLPFFINNSGSKICRLFDGKYTIAKLIDRFNKEWKLQKHSDVLTRDFMKFLLLLEELDLIEYL
jgi:hypothetical protein